MQNLQLGEQLMQQGPAAFDAAATCFYRALQVYPEPQKLLEVLSQSLPEVILSMIIKKMSDDVKAAQEAGAKIEEIE
jgi:import receptor subunit TOM20